MSSNKVKELVAEATGEKLEKPAEKEPVLVKTFQSIVPYSLNELVDKAVFEPPKLVYHRPVDIDDLHGLTVSQMVDKQSFETGKFASDEQEYEYYGEETEDFLEPSPLDSPYPLDSAEMSDISRENEARLKDVSKKLSKAQQKRLEADSVKDSELSPSSSEKQEPVQSS